MAKKEIKLNENNPAFSRRNFLKIGSTGAVLGAVSLSSIAKDAAAKKVDEATKKAIVKKHYDFPNEVRADYKSKPSYSTVHGHGMFPDALRAMGVDVDPESEEYGKRFVHHMNYEYEKGKKGFDQLAKAMEGGAWALAGFAAGPMAGGVGDYGVMTWDNNDDKFPLGLLHQDYVTKEKYQFKSQKDAADAIKRAAKLYGASLVGITHRDERWDYSQQFNPIPPIARKINPMGPKQFQHLQEVGGEAMHHEMMSHTPDKFLHDIDGKAGFSPKTVIVMAFEMDYEAFTTAPSCISGAAAGDGYSRMTKSAYQMAVFLRQLGYKALPTGNDTGLSVPYAIAAGLGEGSRMGTIVTYKYGPRVRIAKVYTDLDFVEYDKPNTFGVEEFCKRCLKCADACPGQAISRDKEPSFEPTHENKDNAFYNFSGVKKWYMDAKKCFKIWAEIGNDCGSCIASCPYNKPDFWHHSLVDGISAAMPGPVHTFMRKMDDVFGYGDTEDTAAVDKFLDSKGKNYNGF
jgi:epoxyqueuosine reductase